MTESFPLQWVAGRPRTIAWRREIAGFNISPAKAKDELIRQLKLLGATNIVLSTNVTTYLKKGKTVPYKEQPYIKNDPGVAVYFTYKLEQYAFACDKHTFLKDNMQVISKIIDALRLLGRLAGSDTMLIAMSGFKGFPEPKQEKKAENNNVKNEKWYEVLKISSLANTEQIKAAFRKLAMTEHPDKGGTTERFNRIHAAYNEGLNSKK